MKDESNTNFALPDLDHNMATHVLPMRLQLSWDFGLSYLSRFQFGISVHG